MIWESVGLMTAIDLAMIGMGAIFFAVVGRRLHETQVKGFFGVGLGLSGFGLFYLADLFVMWVLPSLTSPSQAMAAMETLHLNYHWGVMLVGIACMLWGFGQVGGQLTAEIRERKKTEQALNESRERFELAAEGADAGLWDWPDMSRDGQWWSPRWYALLGYADGEVESSYTNFKALVHPDDRDRLAVADKAHIQNHEPFEIEYRLKTKSGEHRWFRGRGQARVGEDGKAYRMSGSIQDISRQKHDESAQAALDVRLREIEKLESLGLFARGFAHDFNNLLTSVMGNASFALTTLPQTSPLRPHMEAIEEAASHGSGLTQQLLSYAGEGKGITERIDVSAFVEETAPLLAASVPPEVVLRYTLPRGLPPIVADANQIRQVLVNLVTNAADAICPDDGVITVTTGTLSYGDSDSEDSVRSTTHPALSGLCSYIEVSDDGPGIDESTQARMWDPFFSTKPGGRGLGLAVVDGIVRAHGGAIRVVSQLGAGAAFKVVFPAPSVRGPEAFNPPGQ
jgi:PAS domain S-box-containing protein